MSHPAATLAGMATVYYTASSIDGFIATEDHSLEWLLSRDIDEQGPMHYDAFAKNVGAMAMGASTYQWVLEHEKGWNEDRPTWVFTHRTFAQPDSPVTFVQGEVTEVYDDLVAAAGDKDIWVVGGGDLVGQFHDAGLLDEVWVQWAPVALGGGAPLLPRHVELRLEEVARNRDFACARYSVVRPAGQDAAGRDPAE